ncbi:winged helix DNA-binding protein [Kineococcus xinjiangensis]|uniref:Winged helix DNA-binding protein n=1 Tax=Kineococcus xinjiangensis TaxID=512762 RepID=A0A2S6IW54_9ACTN|nr:winged helix DNA-binding domain-containing protein [Kineococcus xinjiangensis]PPK98578.1 winged helix DNA-binding protein [Kineococcus xinjiangensis]
MPLSAPPSEVALLRLVAHRLAGPPAPTAAEAVRELGAVQAQDLPGALTSVALRTAVRDRGPVEASLDAGEVVRAWPMRGTLHLVAAADLPMVLELTAERTLAGTARRRAELGLGDAELARAREVAEEALPGGGLRRDDLLGAWAAAGLAVGAGRGYHLLLHLALRGLLCFGPLAARRAASGNPEQLVVLAERWIPNPSRVSREEALARWAERYFRSHGPATARDLARWAGLTAADVRAGIAAAGDRLLRLDVEGVEHLLDPATPDRLASCRAQARGLLLLPGFDELVLGYADRSATVAPEFAERIVPGGNGVFRATVVDDGRVVGTWRHRGSGGRRRIEATPFTSWRAGVAEALEALHAELP